MSHSWLRPFAAGAAFVAVASIGGWLYSTFKRQPDVLIVRYTKPTGLHRSPQPDPFPKIETASQYVVYVAKQCGVARWSIESSPIASDADDVAQLTIRFSDLSDQSFNCIARQTKPPLVAIERKSS